MSISLEQQVDETANALDAADLFFGHGTDNAFDEAAWLVLEACDLDPSGDDIPWDQSLTPAQQSSVAALLKRRIESGEPLAYLVNRAWFAGHDFFIDHRAIVPRSHIGEWIADRFFPWRADGPAAAVLDLCTGSGCIAVALAHAFPEATVDASDISDSALEVAEINVARYAVQDRVRLKRGDLFEGLGEARYDLIVCNPPYVSDEIMDGLPGEYRHEPALAFAGGASGLDFINRLMDQARKHLTEDGLLVVEAGSARESLEAAWPRTPFSWLMSENGEAVVFALEAAELDPSPRMPA